MMSISFSQPITPTGETTTFTAGGERISLPSLSLTLEPDSCVEFYWDQYAVTYDDLTVEQAQKMAENMLSNRFATTNCYIPISNLTRIEIVNQITQAVREQGFTVTSESGGELNLLQYWHRSDDAKNLNLFYYYGFDDRVLLMVQEETLLTGKRRLLDEYLIEVALEVDLKLLLGEKDTEVENDCTFGYPLEDEARDAEPPYELDMCEVVVFWENDEEYSVKVALQESEVGTLTYSTSLEDF